MENQRETGRTVKTGKTGETGGGFGYGPKQSSWNRNDGMVFPAIVHTLKYNPRMSYDPRNNQEVALPTWELSKSNLDDLRKTYIIAEDMSREDVIEAIRHIMHPIVRSALTGEDICFLIPYKQDVLLQYHDKLCFPLLKRQEVKSVQRSFHMRNCRHSMAMTAWAFKAIYENLKIDDLVMTIRDLFYRRSMLFCNQEASNRILVDICLMTGCTRRSLNLNSEEKGSVCGMISVVLSNGKNLDCSDGAGIPDAAKIDRVTCEQHISCVLAVEKGTIYEYLKNNNFHIKHRCIIVTANGTPDISTQSFLKRVQQDLRIPVLRLADADPSGLDVMSVYAQGSLNLAHENFNLAVPSLIWVGISLQDIEDCEIELTEYNSKPLSAAEIKSLKKTLADKYTKLSAHWKAAIRKQLGMSRKASFEILHEKGYNYVADTFLPKKLRDVLGLKEASSKDAKGF